MAYTKWVAINPQEVCIEKGRLKFLVMVNTGAGGLFEGHRFDRDFVRCEEIDGKIILEMSLYHRSRNDMEAGTMMKRGLMIPAYLCDRRPEMIRFNFEASEENLQNGKFRGPRQLLVKEKCSKEF
jgi:hypothetical protein